MRQDDRARFDRGLRRARVSAYAPGAFVGQEGFTSAGEIRDLLVLHYADLAESDLHLVQFEVDSQPHLADVT